MIAIIEYNAGNIASVQNALNRLGVASVVTGDHEEIRRAEKVIFPGVGEAGSAMKYLEERDLHLLIPSLRVPVLGICLGLQLMCTHSEEGDTNGLGIFPAAVKRFPPGDIVPHMGWNSLSVDGQSWIGAEADGSDVYFVHSYYAELCESTVATCEYILPFSAALRRANFYATQFHPEKSATTGSAILSCFLSQ